MLVEGNGGPLAVVVAGATVHDATLVVATLEAVVVERPQPTEAAPQHLCLEKSSDPTGHAAAAQQGSVPHIRQIGEEKPDAPQERRDPARCWGVERTLAWLSTCRAFLARDDAKAQNYLGLLKLACALLWYRRAHRLALLG